METSRFVKGKEVDILAKLVAFEMFSRSLEIAMGVDDKETIIKDSVGFTLHLKRFFTKQEIDFVIFLFFATQSTLP